jgi:formate hydrogenlyase subunit 3/multisubunit Na+/H+ antiporter MnhD subunit
MSILFILVLNLLALNSLVLYKVNASKLIKNLNLGFYCLILIVFVVKLSLNNFSNYNFNDLSSTNINIWFLLFFVIAFLVAMLFLLLQKYNNYLAIGFIMLYLNASIGALLSTQIIHLFIYWELLAIFAGIIIALSSNPLRKSVTLKYLTIHIFGGVLFFIGIINYITVYGNQLTFISLDNPLNYLILAGILINLGVLPFSSWLIDGYSTANPYTSIFLSIFTTKIALLILYTLFNSSFLLVIIGIVMCFYAFIFAIFQTNILKLLALSIIHSLALSIIAIGSSANFDILIYILTSIFGKMLFFFVVIAVYNKKQNTNIYALKNSIAIKSFYGAILIIAALENIGFIGFASFVGKNIMSLRVEELNSSLLNYLFLVCASFSAGIISFKIPFFLLNFKNKNNVVLLDNKIQTIPYLLCLAVLFLISILYTTQVASVTNFLHSMEVLIIGVMLFFAFYYLLKNKEDKINYIFSLLKATLFFISYSVLNKLANINPFYYLHKLSMFSINLINHSIYLKYQKTSSIAFAILVIFCVFYAMVMIL